MHQKGKVKEFWFASLRSVTEMGFALVNGVPIVVAEEIRDFSDEIPETAQELLKRSVFRKLPN